MWNSQEQFTQKVSSGTSDSYSPAFLSGPITGKKSAQGNPLGRFQINTQVVIEDHWVGWAPLTSTDLSLARNKESTDQIQ